MPTSSPQSITIIPPRTSGGSVKKEASQLRYDSANLSDAKLASLFGTASKALADLQSQVDGIASSLRQPIPLPEPIQITAPDGTLIAQLGYMLGSDNRSYSGIWGNNLYVGGKGPDTAPLFSNGSQVVIGQNGEVVVKDNSGNIVAELGVFVGNDSNTYFGMWASNLYVGGIGPESAPLFSNGQVVVLGKNGQVFVQDPYSNIGAWLGTQSEATQSVSGAVSDGGLIKLTVTAHGYRNGDWVNVASVGGVPNATGQWLISVIDANHFDLLGSTFAGAYTSGGTAGRFFSGGAFSTLAVAAGQRITNAVNNGSGLVRLTITAHGYSTGYGVVTTNVGGVPGANGVFLVTKIDANTVDLQGSTFSGSYTSGGISINWPTAKLLAQGDGSLLIQQATITLTGTNGTILLNPQGPVIAATDASGNVAQMVPGQFSALGTSPANPQMDLTRSQLNYINTTGSTTVILKNDSGGTEAGSLSLRNSALTASVQLDPSASTSIQTIGSGDINSAGVYRVGGTQVVQARLAALGTLAGGSTLAQVVTKVNLIITNALGISAGHGLTSD
jgi:hypothetical protein